MTSEDNTADAPISNWTLATGTKPGERKVYAPRDTSTPPRVKPDAKSYDAAA